MKRVGIWILVLLVLFGCAEAETIIDLSSMSISELIELQNEVAVEIDARRQAVTGQDSGQLGINYVAIDHVDIVLDGLNRKCIVITFVWKHSYSKFEPFINLLEYGAFQDGVALDKSYYVDSIGNHSDTNSVKPGVYATIQVAYVLSNSTSPVEVEVIERYSKSGEKVYGIYGFPKK